MDSTRAIPSGSICSAAILCPHDRTSGKYPWYDYVGSCLSYTGVVARRTRVFAKQQLLLTLDSSFFTPPSGQIPGCRWRLQSCHSASSRLGDVVPLLHGG